MSDLEVIPAALGNLFLTAAAAAFLLVVGIGVSRHPRQSLTLYAWLAVPQAAVLAGLAWHGGSVPLWIDAAVTLGVRGLWVPAVVRARVARGVPDHGLAVSASPALLLCGAGAAAALGLRLGSLLAPAPGLALGLLLAAMILGFGVPCVRTELWSQLAGILAGEGALAAALLLLVGGLPVLAEVLALADVLFLAGVLGGIERLVHEVHGDPDARLLERLRG